MRITILLGTFACFVLPAAALSQPVNGLYVSAGTGVNFMQPETVKTIVVPYTMSFGRYSFNVPAEEYAGTSSFNPDTADVVAVGYGLGNGLRIEAEGNYRFNEVTNATYSYERKYGGMANLLYDLTAPSSAFFPYFGGGIGVMHVFRSNLAVTEAADEFAWQGIAGVGFSIRQVPGLAATVEYRFTALGGSKSTNNVNLGGVAATPVTGKYVNDANHSILVGLRYAFAAAPVARPRMPAPVEAPPPPSASHSYMVFFDWDSADLTTRARQIIAVAAQNANVAPHTRLQVNGYTDLSGPAAYNQRLSMQRGAAVAAELVRDGVSKEDVAIEGFGESHPLVPTAKGVREPENRRVEIFVH